MIFVLVSLHLLGCSGDDGGGGGDTPDPCAGVDCGHGECVSDGTAAVCECEEGYVPQRLTCVPDVSTPGDIDGDEVPDEEDNCPAYPNADQDPLACDSHLVPSGPTGNFVTSLLADGRVLILGIIDAALGEAVLEAWIFDPATETFVQTAGPPEGSHASGAAITLSDGRVVVAGGESLADAQLVEIYDPASDSFTRGPDFPGGGFLSTPVLLADGRALFVGGMNEGVLDTTPTIFDGSTFEDAGTLPAAGAATLGASAILLEDGRVLVTGGIDHCGDGVAGTPRDTSSIYDPASNQWSVSDAHMARPRWMHGSSRLPDGRVLVFAGAHGTCGDDPLQFDPSSTEEVYDPEADSFSSLSGESGRHLLGGTVALADGTGFAAGGGDVDAGGAAMATTSRYMADGVAEGPPYATDAMGQARAWLFQSLVLLQDGSVLVPGGSTTEFDRAPGVDRIYPYYDVVIDSDHDGIVDVRDAE